MFNRSTTGYIGEYDFNVSGNINDRVYLGLTMGIHDVHYKHYSEYSENFASNADGIAGLTLIDNRKITGTGVDLKFGAIFRPIEDLRSVSDCPLQLLPGMTSQQVIRLASQMVKLLQISVNLMTSRSIRHGKFM